MVKADTRPIAAKLARICPTPTAEGKLEAILDEIERASKAGAPPNTLAPEWERLDEAARVCKGQDK